MKSTAVWDTVGVLGVPLIKVFGITLYNPAHKQYSFIDTKVPNNVEYACMSNLFSPCCITS